MIIWLIGNGIVLTTRITSSEFALIEGGNLPLRLLEARLLNLAGRYHFRFRLFRLLPRLESILFLMSVLC